MWRPAIALLLVCACTESVGPGRYACTRDAGEEVPGREQCPENYRCGLENYCHRLGDVGTAWRCAEDEDCENGYHCGLDPTRRFRECQDSEKPTASACFVDRDCVPPWRCGLEGVCHARGAAQPYACRFDGGAPEDRWCEAGWRCAADGTCIDPAADALRQYTPAPFPAGDAAALTPALGPIERISASQVYGSGLGVGEQTIAVVEGGRLIAHVVDRRGEQPPVRYDLGPAPMTFAAIGSRGEVGVPVAVTDGVPRVVTATAQGGVSVFALGRDGGVVQSGLLAEVDRFTQGAAATGLAPRVVAFHSDPGHAFNALSGPDDSWNSDYPVALNGFRFGDLQGNRVVDVASVRAAKNRELVWAIDVRGLWVMERANQPTDCFLPLTLPPVSRTCAGPPVPQRPTRLRPLGINDLGVASEAIDGGAEFLTLFDTSQIWVRTRACGIPNPDPCNADAVPLTIALGPCRACPTGKLVDVALLQGNPAPRFEYACSSPDAGSTEHYALTSGTGAVPTCTRVLLDGEPSLFTTSALRRPEQMAPGAVAWSDGDRHAWTGPDSASALSLTLDRAPQMVVRRAFDGMPFAMTARMTAHPEPGLGLFEEPGLGARTGVEGQPGWVVMADGQVVSLENAARANDGKLVARVGPVAALEPPHTAVEARTATGKRVLVVGSGFTLFAGEIDPQGVTPVPQRVSLRAQLRSLSFPRPGAGAYLEGYGVTGAGVVKLVATTASQWSETPVVLPAALQPLEVWHDLERARVGFTNGTVYSLPSRVEIAPALGEEVLDYVQACGHQLALTRTALYRLEPRAGQTVGRWAKQGLPDDFGAGGFAGGRAISLGDQLYLFTRDGVGARWQFTMCP